MISEDFNSEQYDRLCTLLDCIKVIAKFPIVPSVEKPLLSILEDCYAYFPNMTITQQFPILYRLTINKRVTESGENRRVRNIKYLKYPPSAQVLKYGRCNLPGQSVLYATSYGAGCSSLVTMNEMKPQVGDLITETTWKLKENETLTYCPIFRNQPPQNNVTNPRTLKLNRLYQDHLSAYSTNFRKYVDALTQFVADSFTNRFDSDNHLDYIFSAFFSDKILHSFEGGKIDAIWYPSVKNNLSAENLAIKGNVFDNKYNILEVSESVITAQTREGVLADRLSECNRFDASSDEILWDPKTIHQPRQYLLKLQETFGIQLD